ncbi:D-hexose-6-phosphate mutarotase [Shewanella sp. SR44-3]|uniref:D-hexose-6-phosphate mutarotase n=1 Tax=unclassified Shewanella TaxID=196818 RepID=UPI0015FE3B02|nr:D-hexose-6-phosphate mutarotase [Shewanella sp. SR44-3]MBB1270370.1 D-hexose-6-phosphate mutarotase [Shewanella sp. SR44-3]
MASVSTKTHRNGLKYLAIDTPQCQARIFFQGAQITEFTPKGAKPLLWVSAADNYQPGNGVRGGIPICWPWFGQHQGATTEAKWPQHGFARTRIWSLNQVQVTDESVQVQFDLPLLAQDKPFWPYHSQVSVLFTLTDSLTVSLINTNLGDEAYELTQALHTYFPTPDIHRTHVSGFNGAKYIEFAEGPFEQPEDKVHFNKETDRVYTQLSPQQFIHTPAGIISVTREQSSSAVLWNPWIDKSTRLSRFNPDDYLQMLCLEAANVLEDRVILQAGESHTLSTVINWVKE